MYRPATTALNWNGLTVDQWFLLNEDGWDNLLADHVPTGGAGLLAYSPTGNRLTQTDPVTGDITTFTYDNGNRLLTGVDVSGTTTYTYDNNGNQLTIEEPSGDITTNTWDGENRLIQVEHPSGDMTTYAYNGDGLRVLQDDGVAETRFVYDGNNLVLELDDVGVVKADVTYLPAEYAQVLSQHRDLESSFYLCDGIHNVRQLTDDAQVVTDEYSFDGWGKLTSSTGSTANSQLYKGEYLAYRKDPDAGPELQYSTHHRNYNPQTGVFTAADPAKDDLNLYRYVKNNPVNQVDPSGLEEEPRRFHASVKPALTEAKDDPMAAHPELLEWRNQHEQLFRRIAGILALPIENGLGAGIDLSTININTKHGQLSREIEWHEVGREGSVIYTPFGTWAPPLSWTYGILWTEAETQAPPIRIPYDAYDPDSKDLAFQLVLRSRSYDDLMELGKSIGEAVGSAPEKAIRTAFPVLDVAGTVVDTVDGSVKYLNAGPGGGGDWKSVAINILQGYLFYKMWRTARPAKDADTPGTSTQRPPETVDSPISGNILSEAGRLIGRFSRGEWLEIISTSSKLHGGNTIRLSPKTTTTVTGTLSDVNTVATRGANFPGATLMGKNPGGINILRSPQWKAIQQKHMAILKQGDLTTYWKMVTDEFWETINKPWLDDAIKRRDSFRLVSNPTDEFATFVTKSNGTEFVLDATGNRIRSIFGREVDYLRSLGHEIRKDGTVVLR